MRTARDNDLLLDLESVVVNGQRYAVKTDQNRIDSGAPIGSVARRRSPRRVSWTDHQAASRFRDGIPARTSLDVGVEDRGVSRRAPLSRLGTGEAAGSKRSKYKRVTERGGRALSVRSRSALYL